MTTSISSEDVIGSLDRQRRLAWAKFYELARLVHAGDSRAREVAAAALRQDEPPTYTDMSELFLGGHHQGVSVGGHLFMQNPGGEWVEVPNTRSAPDSEQVRRGVARVREALAETRKVGDA